MPTKFKRATTPYTKMETPCALSTFEKAVYGCKCVGGKKQCTKSVGQIGSEEVGKRIDNTRKNLETYEREQTSKPSGKPGNTDLAPHDQDCANFGGMGGLLDGLCVTLKGGQKFGQESLGPLVIAGLAVVVLIMVIK